MFLVAFIVGFSLGWGIERVIPVENRWVRLTIPILWTLVGLVLGAYWAEAFGVGLGVAIGFGWSWARAAAADVGEKRARQ